MHNFGKLQVGMSTHFSLVNFCRKKARKYQQNLKCHNTNGSINGNECIWNLNANGIPILNKQKREKES
jgi:hypothetical protein